MNQGNTMPNVQMNLPGFQTLSPDAKAIMAVFADRLGQSMKPVQSDSGITLDVTKSVTDRVDLPRPEHADEDWQEQTLCFLEGQRRAFLSFLNLSNKKQSFEALTDRMRDEAEKFVDMHGFLESDELDDDADVDPDVFPRTNSAIRPQLMNKKTIFYEKGGLFDSDPILESKVTIEDFGDGVTVKTVKPLEYELDGVQFDRIEVDGEKLWVECQHDSNSSSAKDHPFAFSPASGKGKK